MVFNAYVPNVTLDGFHRKQGRGHFHLVEGRAFQQMSSVQELIKSIPPFREKSTKKQGG